LDNGHSADGQAIVKAAYQRYPVCAEGVGPEEARVICKNANGTDM